MTVPNTDDRDSYVADGATGSFDFTFRATSEDQVTVYIDDELQEDGYSVSLDVSGIGGSVAFDTDPDDEAVLLILRSSDYLQGDALDNAETLPPKTIERMIDKAMIVAQQLSALIAGCLRLPASIDPEDVDTELAAPVALEILRWNEDADAIESVSAAAAFTDAVPDAGLGNVIGPSSSTARTLALWDSSNGQLLKDGPAIGSAEQFLKSQGAGADPIMADLPFGLMLGISGFRLSLETGVSVSATDQTNKSTLYLVPHRHKNILLKVSGVWKLVSTAEISLALSGLTSGKNYDVFAYWTGSAVALELSAAWTNDSTRATALASATTYGVTVKSGDESRTWLGTFRSTSTSATELSAANIFLWNAYNQVDLPLATIEATNYGYATATWRSANASTTAGVGRTQFVCGIAGALVHCQYNSSISPATSGGSIGRVGLNLNSTSATPTNIGTAYNANGAAVAVNIPANLVARAALGFNFIQNMEYADVTGTVTFNSVSGTSYQTGRLAA